MRRFCTYTATYLDGTLRIATLLVVDYDDGMYDCQNYDGNGYYKTPGSATLQIRHVTSNCIPFYTVVVLYVGPRFFD